MNNTRKPHGRLACGDQWTNMPVCGRQHGSSVSKRSAGVLYGVPRHREQRAGGIW